jgi:hypothetical protein
MVSNFPFLIVRPKFAKVDRYCTWRCLSKVLTKNNSNLEKWAKAGLETCQNTSHSRKFYEILIIRKLYIAFKIAFFGKISCRVPIKLFFDYRSNR